MVAARRPPAQPASQPDQPTVGLDPGFLEANQIGPTPGRFAPVPEMPGPGNPDSPGPDLTPAHDADEPRENSPRRRLATPTTISGLRSGPFETLARGLMRAAGGLLNRRVQVDDEDRSFIPETEDTDLFAPAAGRIVARHLPLPDKADLSELEDLGIAFAAVASWVGKGLMSAWDARANKRRARSVLRGAGAAVYQGGAGDIEEQTQ